MIINLVYIYNIIEKQREKNRKERYERSSPSERLMIDHLDNCQRCMDWLHDKMEFFMANINFNEHSDNWDKEEEYIQSLYNTIHRASKLSLGYLIYTSTS